jgi:hypothetical protein
MTSRKELTAAKEIGWTQDAPHGGEQVVYSGAPWEPLTHPLEDTFFTGRVDEAFLESGNTKWNRHGSITAQARGPITPSVTCPRVGGRPAL